MELWRRAGRWVHAIPGVILGHHDEAVCPVTVGLEGYRRYRGAFVGIVTERTPLGAAILGDPKADAREAFGDFVVDADSEAVGVVERRAVLGRRLGRSPRDGWRREKDKESE
jgi:hypothetical protein